MRISRYIRVTCLPVGACGFYAGQVEPLVSRIALFEGVGKPFRLVMVPVPDLGPGEVLVKVDMAAICASDRHTVFGRRGGHVPVVLGHEAVGRVVGAGERITWTIAAHCGACRICLRGIPQKCEHLEKFGHSGGIAPNGGFATYCVLPSGTRTVVVPDAVPDAVACVANCATATVAAVLRLAGPLERVAVLGCGMLGLTACAMAASRGAAVMAIDADMGRVQLAESFGAGATLDAVDCLLDFSGNTDAIARALPLVDTGGHVVLAGSVMSCPPLAIDPEWIVRRMITITGMHNYRPDDLEAAVAFLAANHARYPFAQLVEKTFALDDIDAAFEFAEHARPVRAAILPDWRMNG